jgi:hypothetical protein
MKRPTSRQAEAERERRARIIGAGGEYQTARKLAQAASALAADPAALHLRLLRPSLRWPPRRTAASSSCPLAHTAAAACRLQARPDKTSVPVWVHRQRVLRRAGSAGNADMP